MRKLIILLVFSLTYSVCLSQNKEKPMFKTDTISLFKSDNSDVLKNQISNKIKEFDDEVKNLAASNDKIGVVTYKIHYKNDEVYITDFIFLTQKINSS